MLYEVEKKKMAAICDNILKRKAYEVHHSIAELLIDLDNHNNLFTAKTYFSTT